MNSSLPLLNDAEVAATRTEDVQSDAGFGALRTEHGCLPMSALDVHAYIDGLIASIELAQTFVNNHPEPLEATYVFPLPDRAAVTRFRLEVAGRVIEGMLKERGEARKEYTEAIEAGHRAAISEEERPGVFSIRVGNLPPGEKAVVRLTLAGPLPYSDGQATFRFPLVVAPRYIPGSPLPGPAVGDGVASDTDAVPDASRISPPVLLPGFTNPVRLSLAVSFSHSALAPIDMRSSLHSVVEEEGGGGRCIRLQPGERLDRDFILRFRLGEENLRSAISLQPDADREGGTFALTLLPPLGDAVRPREIVFVLDRSGSMGGWKIVAARRAMSRMVDTLTDIDRFAVLAFDDRIDTPPDLGEGLVAATNRNRFRAVEFLAGIEARGGTEMVHPLEQGLDLLAKDRSQKTTGSTVPERVLVLVTDGQIGNEDQILRQLAPRLKNIRVFTLGIDMAVNAGFLNRLASLAGGQCELVESEDRLDEVMAAVHRRIGAPVLTDLKLEPAGLKYDKESIAPARLPDLFPRVPLVVLGRYRGQPAGGIALQARDASGQMWSSEVRADSDGGKAMGPIWARARLRDLEDRYVTTGGDREAIEKEIVTTSLKFGVLCRFTAFVAVDRSEVVNAGGKVQGIIQPVEAPAGWESKFLGGVGAMSTPCYSAPMAAMSHKGAYARRSRGHGSHADWDDDAMEECTVHAYLQEFDPGAAGTPKARSGSGLLQRLLKFFSNKRKRASKPVAQFDYGPILARAAEILTDLRSHSTRDAATRFAWLCAWIDRLEKLFADLAGAGDHRPVTEGFGTATLTVREVIAAAAPPEDEIQLAWTAVERALEDFLAGTKPLAVTKREGFWK